jgi:hypothetical protein
MAAARRIRNIACSAIQIDESAIDGSFSPAEGAPTGTPPLAEPAVEFLGVLKGMQTVKGVLDVSGVGAEDVYALLADYPAASRVFGNIYSSEVSEAPDGAKEVLQVGPA